MINKFLSSVLHPLSSVLRRLPSGTIPARPGLASRGGPVVPPIPPERWAPRAPPSSESGVPAPAGRRVNGAGAVSPSAAANKEEQRLSARVLCPWDRGANQRETRR